MTTTYLESTEYKSISHFSENSTTNNQNIFELFNNTTQIFTKVRPNSKAGSERGWLNNLLTPVEAQGLTNYNVGIALGRETQEGDYTVCFDRESGGSLPEDSQNLLEEYALAVWTSPHGGRNYLLTVSEEALNELQQYKERVYITGDDHDLEILKSKHALIPPSSINHNSCSENKPCNGSGGWASYNLEKTGIKQTIDLQTVQRIVEPLPVEKSQKTTHNTNNRGSNRNEEVSLPELPKDFNPNAYFDENIPGTDSFLERLEKMLQNERVCELLNANNSDRSKAELELQRYISWYFNADRTMVQYIFDELLPMYSENKLKYHENKNHRKNILNNVGDYTPRPYYLTGMSFNLREQLATEILNNETVSVNELYGNLLRTDKVKQYEKRTIQESLKMFTELDLIERESKTTYRNKRIDEKHCEKLEELNKEYEPTNIQVHYD